MNRYLASALLVLALGAGNACSSSDDDDTDSSANAGSGTSGTSGGSGSGGGSSATGSGGKGGDAELMCNNKGDANTNCSPKVPPFSGECAPAGECCHRSSNLAKIDKLGPDESAQIEYRLN